MKKLRKGQMIIFSSMNDFTGQSMELEGTVVGNHLDVRKKWPIEQGEADEGMFLVYTKGLYSKTWHAVHLSEVLHMEQEQ